MKRLLLLLVILALCTSVQAAAPYTFTQGSDTYWVANESAGTYYFTPPAGVTSVSVNITASGGTGGPGAIGDESTPGCGGQGGKNSTTSSYASIAVTPLTNYTITLGGATSTAFGYTVSKGVNGAAGSGLCIGGGNGYPGYNGSQFDKWSIQASNGATTGFGFGGSGGYYPGAGGGGGGGDLNVAPGLGGAGAIGLVTIWYPTSAVPVPSFTQDVTSGDAPLTVSFTDTSSGSPISWMWNYTSIFGANTPVTFATTQNPTYSFPSGNYSIQLTATNIYGSATTAALSSWVNATSIDLSAQFSVNKTSGYPTDCFQFTDESIGNPDTWNWSFGDGSLSALKNPTHCYASTGSYSVALNVSRTDY